MYQILAKFYDSLVKDDEATLDWVHFIEKHAKFSSVLEYACGSGEITLALANLGYQVKASDLSFDMIEMAKQKEGADKIQFEVRNMIETTDDVVDLVLCLCDSMNYVIDDNDFIKVLQNAYHNLKPNGTFIFDVHSLDRLEEFTNEFYEEGMIDNNGYEWSIETNGDKIFQNFVFFDENAHPSYEQHIQKVYDPEWIKNKCEEIGFEVEIYTDFKYPGITSGEKYFYVCRRVK